MSPEFFRTSEHTCFRAHAAIVRAGGSGVAIATHLCMQLRLLARGSSGGRIVVDSRNEDTQLVRTGVLNLTEMLNHSNESLPIILLKLKKFGSVG